MIDTPDKNLYLFIAQRIRAARIEADLTQEELANELGLSRASVVNIELGNQRILLHHLYLIAMATNVDILYFLPSITGEELMNLPSATVTTKEKEKFSRSVKNAKKLLQKTLDDLNELAP